MLQHEHKCHGKVLDIFGHDDKTKRLWLALESIFPQAVIAIKNVFIVYVTFGEGEGVCCSLSSIGQVKREGVSSRASRFLPSGSHSTYNRLFEVHVVLRPPGLIQTCPKTESGLAFERKDDRDHSFL